MSAAITGAVIGIGGSLIAGNAAKKAQQAQNTANAEQAAAANEANWNQYLLSRGINPGGLAGVPGGAGSAVNTVLPLGFTAYGQGLEQVLLNRILGISPSMSPGNVSPQMSLSDDAVAQAYFDSDPGFAAEYNRHMAWSDANRPPGEDDRTPVQWLRDHLAANPDSMGDFQTFVTNTYGGGGTTGGGGGGTTSTESWVLPPQYQRLLDYGPQTLDALYQGQFLAQQQAKQDEINAARSQLAGTEQMKIDELRKKYGELNQGQLSDLDRILQTRTTGSQGIYDAAMLQADTFANAAKQATENELQRQSAQRALAGFVGSGSGDALMRARTLAQGYQQASGARAQAGVEQANRLYGINEADATGRFGVNSEYLKALTGFLDSNARAAEASALLQNTTDNAALFSNDVQTRLANLNAGGGLAQTKLQLDQLAAQAPYNDINALLGTLQFFRQNQPGTPGYTAAQYEQPISGGQIAGSALGSLGQGLSSYYQNNQLINAIKGLNTGGGTNVNPLGNSNTSTLPFRRGTS